MSCSTRPLDAPAHDDGRELIALYRQKGLRLNTVKGIARTLSTLLSQAVEDDKLPAHPCLRMGRYLRRGDEPRTIVQPLTREEATHLVNTAAETYPRWHPWVPIQITVDTYGQVDVLLEPHARQTAEHVAVLLGVRPR